MVSNKRMAKLVAKNRVLVEELWDSNEFSGLVSFLNASDLNSELRALQSEIIENITPLVEADSGSKVYAALMGLIRTLNEIGFVPLWDVAESRTNILRRDFGSTRRVLNFRKGGKWLICRRYKTPTDRHVYYGLVMMAIQSGKILYLRKCKECSRFCIVSRLSGFFCGADCRNSYNNRGAKDRVAKSRRNKRERLIRQRQRTSETENFKLFNDFINLTLKTKPNDGELRRLRPVLKLLGKGDVQRGRRVTGNWESQLRAGKTTRANCWQQFNSNIRNRFLEIWRR